jgi:hypothetical protein
MPLEVLTDGIFPVRGRSDDSCAVLRLRRGSWGKGRISAAVGATAKELVASLRDGDGGTDALLLKTTHAQTREGVHPERRLKLPHEGRGGEGPLARKGPFRFPIYLDCEDLTGTPVIERNERLAAFPCLTPVPA